MRRVLVVILVLLAGCGVRPAAPPTEPTVSVPKPRPVRPGCPSEGVRLSLVGADSAMGLRAVTIELANCGSKPYTVNGYPLVRLYDEEDQEVRVVAERGSGSVASPSSFDNPPQEVVLQPGEKAWSGLMWRNLVNDATVEATTAVRIEAATAEGRPWHDVPMDAPNGIGGTTTVDIDLGNTTALGVRAWLKA